MRKNVQRKCLRSESPIRISDPNLRKITGILSFLFIFLFCGGFMLQVYAQQSPVTGTVLDETGQPVIGASVVQKGTTKGSITDMDGKFTLNVPGNATIVITYLGYSTQEVPVNNQNNLMLQLQEDTKVLDEVVVVGYGTQKKVTLTGAVSAIKGGEIVKTVNENTQNMLAGKVAGVRVTQNTSEPGAFDTDLDIRGMGTPLIVIDGVPRTEDSFQRLNPNDIESISVLKDASAAIYGVRSANGVILVTTKKGMDDGVELNYSGSFTAQVPSGLPATVNPIDYMTLRNERSLHNVNGGSLTYNDDQFEEYRTGKKQGTDWEDLTFQNYAPQTMHNLDITGGYKDKINFYMGFGYLYQEGFFKSGDLNYDKYNLRSNTTAKITDRLTFDLNVNVVMDEQEIPGKNSDQIIRSYWRQGSHIPAYADPEHTMLYHGLIEGDNPVAFMDEDVTGYKDYNKKRIESSASMKYDFAKVKGLSAKVLLSYDAYISDTKRYNKEYNQYRYDEASGKYEESTLQSPSTIEREAYFKTQMLSQTSLNYDNTFDKVHKVSGALIWETQKRSSDNFMARRELTLPLDYLFAGIPFHQFASMNSGEDELYEDSNLALAGKLNYTYSDKYIAEFLFRYDGSSKFAPGDRQWGFFPAVTAGWRISEENFFKDSKLSFINQLKLRTSYGITGDDEASRYQFVSGYEYPTSTSGREFTGGYVVDGEFVASANSKGIPNPNITWYTSKTFDVGVDFEAWHGLLGVTADYFNRSREGLLDERNGGIPTVVGAKLPKENLNSDRTFGYDLEISHKQVIGDFFYKVRAIGSLTRIEKIYDEHEADGSSWDNWKNNQNGRLQGVYFGYEAAGRYESWEDIWNDPTYTGSETLPGDYIYEDWNGDGEIDEKDQHPIRFDQRPWMNYSFIIDIGYKGFDMNMLWQGSSMSSVEYKEQLREPLWGSGDASAMTQFMDRWHPVDPKADPYDPATQWIPGHYAYTGTLPKERSEFNVEDGSYLRLKSIEIGYTLPKFKGVNVMRVYVNAYNLLTFTDVKYIDPEHPMDSYGYLYPLNKSFTFGMNLTF